MTCVADGARSVVKPRGDELAAGMDVHLAADDGLEGGEDIGGADHGVHRAVRQAGVPAAAANNQLERAGRGHEVPWRGGDCPAGDRAVGVEAEHHLHAALQTFAAIQARFEVGRTHLDLAMLAFRGGRERTATEWDELLHASGFTLTRIIPTEAALCLIQAAPRL